MTDIWDLSSYVEAHPGDLDQRWRLAKKLYTAFEYRLALEHLLVLKNEWGPRAHVSRYLAATYFRLGRYDEAIREMRNALDKFPDDLGLREQLARTLVVDDQKEAAVAEWEEILRQKPEHSVAEQAIEKLKKSIEKHANAQAKVEQAKAGASLADANPSELVCPSCGELNSAEFKRCWKCHSLLEKPAAPVSAFAEPPRPSPARVRWPIASGILIAALLALGVFLTLRAASLLPPADRPFDSVVACLDSSFFWTRVAIGVALLIVWPLAWRGAAHLVNVEGRIYDQTLYHYGALLALSTYALMWLPWRFILVAAAAPLLFSAVIAFLALGVRPAAAAGLWAIQMTLVIAVAAVVVITRHGMGPIVESPSIASYVARNNEPAVYSSRLSAPGEIRVVWTSSGSRWFDRHGSRAQMAITPGPHSRPLYLETLKPESEGPPSYEHVRGETFTSEIESVLPAAAYAYRIRSKEPVAIDFTIRALLPMRVELVPYQAVPGNS